MLVCLGRLQFQDPLETWLEAAADPRTVTVLPVTAVIAAERRACPTPFTGTRPIGSSSPAAA
jgi:PIN domain nuclease of toxin-antitoxin system